MLAGHLFDALHATLPFALQQHCVCRALCSVLDHQYCILKISIIEKHNTCSIVIFSNLAVHRQTFQSDSPSTLPLLLASYPSCPSYYLVIFTVRTHRHPWSASNLVILGNHCSDWCVSPLQLKKNMQSKMKLLCRTFVFGIHLFPFASYHPLWAQRPHTYHVSFCQLHTGGNQPGRKKKHPSKARLLHFWTT